MISIYNYTLFEETSGQYSFESQDIEMKTWGSRFGRYGCFQCYFHISPFSFLPFFQSVHGLLSMDKVLYYVIEIRR